MKQWLLALSIALFPLSLAQAPDPVVATVGKASITKSQFDLQFKLFVRDALQRQGQPYTPEAEANFEQFKAQYLQRLARDQAIVLTAEAGGFAAKEEAIEAAVQEVRGQFEDEEALAKALEDAGIPGLDAYRRLVYEALTYNAYVEDVVKKLQPNDAALRLVYTLNKRQFAVPQRFCSAHILVKTAQEASDVLARLGKGEKFADLAKALSQDPGSKEQGGDLGCEPRGTFVEPFELALVALKPGSTTRAPVRTEFGFHVILLVKVEAAGFQPYDAVKGSLEEGVKSAALEKYLDRLVARYPTKLFPENLGAAK